MIAIEVKISVKEFTASEIKAIEPEISPAQSFKQNNKKLQISATYVLTIFD
jgi:hypothetical protein